jgi:hypothetical protein
LISLKSFMLQWFDTSSIVRMNHVLEIRSYQLKPGTREEFHRLFLNEAFPMLQRWNVDVVAHGPSLHDQDSYYLMRRYDSRAHREERENAFYGSDEWRHGPREAILALIEKYTEIVLALDESTIQGLRRMQL